MKVKDIRALLAALDDDIEVKFIDTYDDGIEVVTEDDDFYYSDKEQVMWESDICWCSDSLVCTNTECFRHLTNKNDEEKIFTCSHLMDTDYCPRSGEGEE